MSLLSSLFRRGRHAGPRLLTGRHARRTAARVTEAATALPTVVQRDMAERREHIRQHWRVEDAATGVVGTLAEVRARLGDDPDPEHELVRGHVRAMHRTQGGC